MGSSPTTPKPISQNLGPGSLKFGKAGSEREFAASTTKTVLKPDYKLEDPIPLLSGGSHVPEGEWGGSIEGEFYQEFSMDGLLAWTYSNAGQTMPFTFRPTTAGALAFRGECVISPVEVGGDAGTANTAAFSFTLVGRPEHYNASSDQ